MAVDEMSDLCILSTWAACISLALCSQLLEVRFSQFLAIAVDDGMISKSLPHIRGLNVLYTTNGIIWPKDKSVN